MLQCPEAFGILVKWTIEFSEFDIHYQPQKAIKAQALADFIVKNKATPETDLTNLDDTASRWQLWIDDSSAHGIARADCVILPPSKDPITYNLVLSFSSTNNQAEYEAVITRLLIARGVEAKSMDIFCDS